MKPLLSVRIHPIFCSWQRVLAPVAVCACLPLVLLALLPKAHAQTADFSILAQLDSNPDGFHPQSPLIQGRDGLFYGTTYYGGPSGTGTVYALTPSGGLTALHTFSGVDGAYSQAALVQGSDGSFYGTTTAGGVYGQGTVFQITTAGGFTVLHSFNSALGEGSAPAAALVQGSDGNYYGTTTQGGPYGYGAGAKKLTEETAQPLPSRQPER